MKVNKQLIQTITEIPENLSEPSNKQITITPENGNAPPKIPRWKKIFLRFLQNGLSLRKAFILSLIVSSGIVGLRFFEVFEWLELKTFDHFMQTRFLLENKDNRLLIVAVTDDDIKAQDKRGELGYGNSLRDPSLDKLLTILQQYKPRVIGLDFYRPKPVVDNNKTPTLVKNLQQNNIVTVCKAPDTDEKGDRIPSTEVLPPPEIKSDIPELVCYLRPLKIIGLAMVGSIIILYITCLTTLTINSLWIPFIPALLGLTITSSAFFIINYSVNKTNFNQNQHEKT